MNDYLCVLNEQQKKAVITDNKHNLVLAGAGSGKTRVITSRIIYLVNEKKINPRNILAVTFTNKAAFEMKERVNKNLDSNIGVMVRTFHSFGAYILRLDSYAAMRDMKYQIYDAADSKSVISKIITNYNYTKKDAPFIYRLIQQYKQSVETDDSIFKRDKSVLEIYNEYNEYLQKSNCFDFEDLILQPIKMFYKYPEILDKYRNRFSHILVDEYQDTNKSQFELLKILIGDRTSLMVVGDEDQSIYKFRGANIYNILNFQHDFENVDIIRLEQNYRSTGYILDAANELILKNELRIGKNLFTDKEKGNKLTVFKAENEMTEVEMIYSIIKKRDLSLNDTAILFRTNNQSRPFEQYFNKLNIPYVLIGTIRFFEREEIKDAISLLKWLINPQDRIAFGRFCNKPARGIGNKTLDTFFRESESYNNLYDALMHIDEIKGIRGKKGFKELKKVFENRDSMIRHESISFLLSHYLQELHILDYYEQKDESDKTEKVNNIKELLQLLDEKGKGEEAILEFLEEVSLTASIGSDDSRGRIKLMTVHNAKGLEFDNIFIAGMEDEIFPHKNSKDDEDLEEERRLFYVAVTRARKNLTLSYTRSRNMFGWRNIQYPSQFLSEIPENLYDLSHLKNKYKVEKRNKKKIDFSEDDIVRHKDYGKGKIIRIEYMNGKHLAKIDFWDYSYMDMILEFTSLDKVEE